MIVDEKKKLKGAIEELSNSMTRVDAEKDLQKDIIQTAFDDTGVDKKYIRKLATIYHKQNLVEVQSENDEVQNLYEDLFL